MFLVGRRGGGVGCRGLLGWVCPKRRGLKPRLPGCLQETRRWAGVFIVFPVCSRCAFGVVLHGARADLLRFGHLARSLRRAGTRVRAVRRAGLGRGARGCLDLVVDGGLRRQREFKADHEGRGLVIGDEVGVEGGSHRRRLDPPAASGLRYRGVPGSTNRASRPRPLKTAPAQQTQRAETQESPRIRLQHSVPAWTLLPMRFAQHDGRLSIAWLHALSSSGAE